MNPIDRLGQSAYLLCKFAWSIPNLFAGAVRKRRGQVVREAAEAERLDRIRHPSKYLGK